LTKLLAEHAPRAAVLRRVEDYRGRVIAVDASLSIYQFLVRPRLVHSRSAPLTASVYSCDRFPREVVVAFGYSATS
jgi:hypothetical protein